MPTVRWEEVREAFEKVKFELMLKNLEVGGIVSYITGKDRKVSEVASASSIQSLLRLRLKSLLPS